MADERLVLFSIPSAALTFLMLISCIRKVKKIVSLASSCRSRFDLTGSEHLRTRAATVDKVSRSVEGSEIRTRRS